MYASFPVFVLFVCMNGVVMRETGFLVLERKKDQKIFIGDAITIVVSKIVGDRVYLAIKAPGMSVDREEVRVAKDRDRRPYNPDEEHPQV